MGLDYGALNEYVSGVMCKELPGIEPRSLHKHRDCGDLAEIRRFRWHNVPLYDYGDVMDVAGCRLARSTPCRGRARGCTPHFEATEITVTINPD